MVVVVVAVVVGSCPGKPRQGTLGRVNPMVCSDRNAMLFGPLVRLQADGIGVGGNLTSTALSMLRPSSSNGTHHVSRAVTWRVTVPRVRLPGRGYSGPALATWLC